MSESKRIALGNDEAAVTLRTLLAEHLRARGLAVDLIVPARRSPVPSSMRGSQLSSKADGPHPRWPSLRSSTSYGSRRRPRP